MADSPTPAVQAVLAWLESSDRPALHELDPAAAREAMDALARPEPITEVGSVTDRTIPGPAGDLPVRVYVPASDGPHPVVVFFHGGGFVVGSLDGYDDPCRLLTSAAEAVVVSVDYRLAPEHPFPAAVEDAYAATEWVAAHAGDLPGEADAGRLAVAGDSAGGTLAAVVSLAARDRDGPHVDAQALIYPSVDFRR